MNKYFLLPAIILGLGIAGMGSIVPAQAESASTSIEQRITALEKELAELKRLRAAELETIKELEKTPAVDIGSKGLAITSSDKKFQIRLKGFIQADTRTFIGSGRLNTSDQILIRTARPALEATLFEKFEMRAVADFAGNTPRLIDGFADYKPHPLLNFRAGKFKAPLGLERLQQEQHLPLIERGLATNLVPSRDIGVQIYGALPSQRLEYQTALMTGAPDLNNADNDIDSMKDVAARFFVRPFIESQIEWYSNIGLGVAGSYGERHGSPSSSNLPNGYLTPAQARFFTYRSDVFANGTHWRLNPQAYYYYGPFGALGEYVLSEQNIARGTNYAALQHKAWSAVFSYVLTGENARYNGVQPQEDFDWKLNQWGAWEIAARIGKLQIDDGAFPIYADPALSASSAFDTSFGLAWHLNTNVKLNINYAWTRFENGNGLGRDRVSEKALLTRAQVGF